MYKPSNAKIEDRAIGALANIIDEHQTMRHQFNSMDKEMSWDGYIWIYNNVGSGSEKRNYDDKVPVQIKGHIDGKGEYINKQYINYRVSLEDLEVYFRDRGVLYFQIFMSMDGRKREIFYVSLFPTKIKYYLEKAKKKGNKKDINISFSKLEKKAESFYAIVKQFSNESKKQGFGHEQLVQNAIKRADFNKIKEITASVVGAANEYEFLKRLGTGDVSFYAKFEGSSFSIPVEWQEGSIYYMIKEIDTPISIAGKKYYDSYKIRANSNEELILLPSDNIQIELNKGKFNFKPKTDIQTLRRDAEFIFAAIDGTEIKIGEHSISFGKVQLPARLREELQFYVELDDVFTKIGFQYLKPFSEIQESTIKKFVDILALQKGKKNHLFKEKAHVYNMNIDGKYIPVIVFKNDFGGQNELFNAIYSNKYQLYAADEAENHYSVPMYSHISGNVMKNLYRYDVDILQQQIIDTEFNQATEASLNIAGLNLIHAYDGDKENNQRLLAVAEDLYDRMIDVYGENTLYIINKMQIKRRLNLLSHADINKIASLISVSNMEDFGKYVVLGNKEKAEKFFKMMSDEEQNTFKEYPIYTLYTEL